MSKTYNVFVNSTKSTMKLDVERIVIQPVNKEKSNQITLQPRVIDHVDWFLLSSYATLHIYTTGKLFYAISELKKSEKDSITDYLKDQFSLGPESINSYNVQIAGQNEGELSFHEKSFSLIKDGRTIINIPFSKIDQVQATSINDLTLEFDTDEDQEGESLLSIRFLVPSNAKYTAKELRSELDQRTNLLAGTDNHIAELRDVNFVKPKKKYNLRFCNDLLFMCSKEGSHKIPYSKISMIHRFSIPSDTDKRSEYILISLSRPIRQGQKSYPHLVIETSASDPVSAEGIDEKKTFIDAFEDLMARVGEIRFQKTDKYYKNVGNEQGSNCSYKNQQGLLYMTPDAFVFLHSYVVYIPFKNVKSVKFDIGKSKKFSITVTDKTQSYTFQKIDTYAYVQIDDKDDEESQIDREQMIKECSYNGLESFYKYIRKYELKIEDRHELKNELQDLKAAISTHDRQAKVHAKEIMSNIKAEDKLLGVDMDNDEEEDEDFNPDAKGSDDDKDDDDDDDDDEAEGDDDDDDDDDGDAKKDSDDDDKDESD